MNAILALALFLFMLNRSVVPNYTNLSQLRKSRCRILVGEIHLKDGLDINCYEK